VRLVDIALTPNPSSPFCWSVIGVELNERSNRYRVRRGTLSVLPAWKPPTSCASHRILGRARARVIGEGRLALSDEVDQPLDLLRDLARNDCWARAWLRFARAPVIAGGALFDLRFANPTTQNLTHLALATRAKNAPCPAFVPNWGMPRADLLK
jgi:inner membrane protein